MRHVVLECYVVAAFLLFADGHGMSMSVCRPSEHVLNRPSYISYLLIALQVWKLLLLYSVTLFV